MANLSEVSQDGVAGIHYYRSRSLLSPDGQYAAYSRIQMQAQPNYIGSRVSSVLYLEQLATGQIQVLTTSSPLADGPFNQSGYSDGFHEPTDSLGDVDLRGTIAILIPVAWSANGEKILAREFEAVFGSSMASDYAVVWDRSLKRVSTLSPSHISCTTAVLLGWSQSYPDRVLFRAGTLGTEPWLLWTVDQRGETTVAPDDQPVVFGHTVISDWTGPQAVA